MPYIQNYSLADAISGNHFPVDNGAVLIRISDPGVSLRECKHQASFSSVYTFGFFDHDKAQGGITQAQGNAIAAILTDCLTQNKNVVVHCTAGICRSGAVVECAKMIGFKVIKDTRIPNVRVKKAIMYALGLGYEPVDS